MRSGRWRGRWAGGREINITLSASRCTTGAVTEILSKECVVSLHSGCGRCIATRHRTPDHIKAILTLIQPQFVVSSRGRSSKIHSAPFDIEDPVGRSARHRGEDTAGSTRESRAAAVSIGALVIPVGKDGVVMSGPRQRTDVGEVRGGSRKLRIAVGGHCDAVEGLVVQGVGERQRNGGYLIVPMIAAVGRPCHDAAAYLVYHVLADARSGR